MTTSFPQFQGQGTAVAFGRPRRSLRRFATDCAVKLWFDAKREWVEMKAAAQEAASTLRLWRARCGGLARIGLLGLGVAYMADAYAGIGPAAPHAFAATDLSQPGDPSVGDLSEAVSVETSAFQPDAAQAEPLAVEPEKERQRGWAKFFVGFYLSSFVALGLCARLTDA